MTSEVVENVWLEPGADFKELLLSGNQLSLWFSHDTPNRPPIWEKWVGRFGAHKLWDYIELTTKSGLSKNEIVVRLDWSLFEKINTLRMQNLR